MLKALVIGSSGGIGNAFVEHSHLDRDMIESETRQADWRRANPQKYDAHLAVQKAVKSGLLEKQACEVCGIHAVDAHHDQYEQQLQVRWLCRRHHVRLHQYGEDMFPVLPHEQSTLIKT